MDLFRTNHPTHRYDQCIDLLFFLSIFSLGRHSRRKDSQKVYPLVTSFCLFVLASVLCRSVFGDGEDELLSDLDRFLIEGGFEFIFEDGNPKIFPGGHDEKYLVKGNDGHYYKLRIKGPFPIYGEIGTAALARVIGLPNGLVYPALVQRRTDGMPTPDVAQRLNPSAWGVGSIGNHNDWIPASLQRVHDLRTWSPTDFNPNQLAQHFGQLILNFVVGNNDFNHEDNIANVGGSICTLDATQSFRFYPTEGQIHLRQFLGPLPLGRITNLRGSEATEFANSLNSYISRLESLSDADLKQLFGPYFRQMEQRESGFNYLQELKRRIRAVRSEAIEYLGSKAPPSVGRALAQSSNAHPAPISLPSLVLEESYVPVAHHHTPKELLWAYFFRSFWRGRKDAERGWGSKLGVPDSITVSHLLRLVRSYSKETCAEILAKIEEASLANKPGNGR